MSMLVNQHESYPSLTPDTLHVDAVVSEVLSVCSMTTSVTWPSMLHFHNA